MHKFTFAFLILVLFSAAFFAPQITNAAESALCDAEPHEIAQGETTVIACVGFSALTYVNVYYAEPDGTAVAFGSIKTDASGSVAFGFTNGVKDQYSFQIGTYKFVIQELGLAETILRYGTVEITLKGDGDHVAGASLYADKSVYDRSRETILLTGAGFLPGEMVTLWIQRPTLCSSYTGHYVDGKNGATFENIAIFDLVGTYAVDGIKANGAGGFITERFFGSDACEGTWRYAARGNTSGLGAWTEIVLTGASVTTNAWLVPSKTSVGAFNDSISFYAYGFGANEIINCWTTSPDGRAVPYGIQGSFDQIKIRAGGDGVIYLRTGSRIISPDDPFYNGDEVTPLMSEGSLGEWAMTCTGLASGSTAIARYTVYGGTLDP